MSKSIAVIDTPKECITCDLIKEGFDEDMMDIIVCCLTDNEISYDKHIPSWCPLKDVPEKRHIGEGEIKITKCISVTRELEESTQIINAKVDYDVKKLIAKGYNDCIDEILGDIEDE